MSNHVKMKDMPKAELAELLYNRFWEIGRGPRKPFDPFSRDVSTERWLRVAQGVRDRAREDEE